MTRRNFIKDLGGAASAVALWPGSRLQAAGALSETGLTAIDAADTPAKKVRVMERFVHHRYYDAKGLMYSLTDWSEERPFVPGDFSLRDSNMGGPELSEWLSYEDSTFTAGLFLTSQCYRYRATHDPEALEYARKAFAALETDYLLTEGGSSGGWVQRPGIIEMTNQPKGPGKGWFCKPYGGVATGQTSTEQNFWPVCGLYLYWPLAPPEIRPRIARILGEVSEHWRGSYRFIYLGDPWDMETSYPRAPRHMISWAAIHRMAYEVTKDPAAYDEYLRLDGLFGAMPTPLETARGLGEPAYISTEDRAFHVQVVMAGEILADLEPNKRHRYVRGIENWWRFSQIGQRPDLTSYYYIRVDSATGRWEKLPTSVRPRPLWTSPMLADNGTWPVCLYGIKARQAVTSAILVRFNPNASAARELWTRIYGGVQKYDLRWKIDPESALPPELRWTLRVMTGDSLALYPLGYWYAKAHQLGLAGL